ncbi:glutamate receptor ionotropic, kainate 2 isoform X2 [Schistocerca americana]|uniref:glutamate receptor ionotropic, kainate 2 isoform X2 n=1 Tax=Schistocerca americana TaxID=7009 RepID=UPI001F502EA0|nr:glutamate receptor ionotropic, kainate 2 isoform X2 [Schistocerca americana]XP_047102840.1 glutamate receptor ionotropic, kainate 2 isoform X1 [Schistocerca piceifrons]XP_049781522.1 glutamate receptor ionotropic, kainate 2 isoform X2 [Schistocerca cancellata]XP_049781523.1 glutamate receptor ionotropic, kainate 2 isoform X2 [Schistocerca cancellata]
MLVALLALLPLASALPEVIRIGGLFHPADDRQEVAFRYAVDRLNADRSVLPRSRLSAQIEKISPQDSFHASKRVCHLLRSGVAAIFGPQSGQTASHVQSICDTMEIPHLETRWDYRLRRESCLVNLYPHPTALSKAYVDLVRAWGWKSFTIIYENNEGLVRLQELLKAHGPSEFPIAVRQLGEGTDYRPLLKQIKNSAESHIVLDCSTSRIYDVLKQAQQIGMMSDYHSYLITSLDLHSVDLEEFKYGGTNITAFRLVDPEKPEIKKVIRDWGYGSYGRKADMGPIRTETALMYDAVHLFAKALHDLDSSQRIDIKPLSCDAVDTWQHGYSLINYMKIVEMQGLTGVIKFDNQGFRSNFLLDIVELNKDGLKKIGTWNSTEGVNFTRTYGEVYTQIVESLQNKTFVVTTILSSPYCMRKESSEKLTGNAQFEGYGIDLIHEIANILCFNYTFKLVPDGRYGSYNPETKEWDGMMKELLDQKADLAIADLTITYDREQAVDFTMPFMNLGISILYRKPIKQPPNLFSFLSPLSLDVWIYMATAYLGVSVLLFILARFSPYEWDNPHPCNDEPDVLENQFSLLNSLWFTIGSLMQQGSDIAPKAVSTRMVAGMWWFFTLIMISSYTANLAAFLTVERMDSPIESAEDLAKQTKIKYGALRGGSTAAFFRDSNFSTYQRMWSFMESARPSVFTSSNVEGVDRVVKGKGSYAFLMESTSIEYVIERNCELTQVGGLLDSKGYGIAMPPNSPYRTAISGAILKLQEEGKLHILKTRWWKEKRGGGTCRDDTSKSSSTANELGLANVGGVFVVLMGGMGVACVIAVCEFVWKSRKVAVEERSSICSEMAAELKFALRCRGSTKPVRRKRHVQTEEEHPTQFMPLGAYGQYDFIGKELLP